MKKIKIFIKKNVPRQYHSKISFLYNYLKSLYLFGFKYRCNFCNGHFRKLFSAGLKKRYLFNSYWGDIVILCVPDVIGSKN